MEIQSLKESVCRLLRSMRWLPACPQPSRGALVADQLAEYAQFFSFGTNDLTQMTFGFSRDDAGKFLVPYVEKKILPTDPFETLDQVGVGQLMRTVVEKRSRCAAISSWAFAASMAAIRRA